MDHIVNVGVLGKDFVELLLIGDVAVVVLGSLAADEFDSAQHFGVGVVEVVDDDDFVVCFEEGEGGEGADVASASMSMLAGGLNAADSCRWEVCIPSDEHRSDDHFARCCARRA